MRLDDQINSIYVECAKCDETKEALRAATLDYIEAMTKIVDAKKKKGVTEDAVRTVVCMYVQSMPKEEV